VSGHRTVPHGRRCNAASTRQNSGSGPVSPELHLEVAGIVACFDSQLVDVVSVRDVEDVSNRFNASLIGESSYQYRRSWYGNDGRAHELRAQTSKNMVVTICDAPVWCSAFASHVLLCPLLPRVQRDGDEDVDE